MLIIYKKLSYKFYFDKLVKTVEIFKWVSAAFLLSFRSYAIFRAFSKYSMLFELFPKLNFMLWISKLKKCYLSNRVQLLEKAFTIYNNNLCCYKLYSVFLYGSWKAFPLSLNKSVLLLYYLFLKKIRQLNCRHRINLLLFYKTRKLRKLKKF